MPSRPFSLTGDSWGAWELVARYTDTDLNWHRPASVASTAQLAGILGGDERIVALGVNWYLNRNVRVMLDDNIVTVNKGIAAHPGPRQPGHQCRRPAPPVRQLTSTTGSIAPDRRGQHENDLQGPDRRGGGPRA